MIVGSEQIEGGPTMDDQDRRVERSPADLLRLVVAAALFVVSLLVVALFEDTLVGFAEDVLRGLDAFGAGVIAWVVVSARVATVAMVVGGLIVVVATRRWRAAATVLVAGALGGVLFTVVEGWAAPQGAMIVAVPDVLGPVTSDARWSATALAVATAALAAGAPWTPRGIRRAGWAVVVVASLLELHAVPGTGAVIVAASAGWFAGSFVLVVLGGPVRRPTAAAVARGLAAVGLDLASLEVAAVDARGSTPYFGTIEGGRPIFVKVLGCDERSADLLFRLYRFVRRRSTGDDRPFGSLRQAVEHEALVACMAHNAGVRTPEVLAIAVAEPAGVVLAYEGIDGRSLDRVGEEVLTDAVLVSVWAALGRLRRHRIAHRDLRLANVFLDVEGEVWLIDFGFSQLAVSDDLLARDVAELVAALSVTVGAARAVSTGIANLGRDSLAQGLDHLRPALLSTATRKGLSTVPGLLDEIRGQA